MKENKYLKRSPEDFLEISLMGHVHVVGYRKADYQVYERILNHFHYRINEKQKYIILGHLGAMLRRYSPTLVYNCFVNRIDELKGVSVVPILKNIEYDSLNYIDEINRKLEERSKNNRSSHYQETIKNHFWNGEYYNKNIESTFKFGFGE